MDSMIKFLAITISICLDMKMMSNTSGHQSVVRKSLVVRKFPWSVGKSGHYLQFLHFINNKTKDYILINLKYLFFEK